MDNTDPTRTFLKCDQDSAPDGRSLVSFSAEAGRAYQVWIARLDNLTGPLLLNWRLGRAPRLAALSANQFIAEGEPFTLSALATNVVAPGVTTPLAPPGYHWLFEGQRIAGGPLFTVLKAGFAHAGSYTLIASNDIGATSAVVRVAVYGAASSEIVGAGATTDLFAPDSADVCGTAPARYQWLRNGTALVNQTNRNLKLTSTQPGDAGSYSVTVSNCVGSFLYPAASVTVTVDLRFELALPPGGPVTLRWLAAPGKTYRVEYRTSLASPVWTPLSTHTSPVAATLTVTEATLAPTQRFYRIVLLD